MNFEAQIPSASDLVKTNLVIYFERRPIFALESCFHFSHFLNWWRSQQERRLRTQETNKAEFAENGDPEFQERHLRGGITITTSTLQRGAEFCPTKLNRNISELYPKRETDHQASQAVTHETCGAPRNVDEIYVIKKVLYLKD